MSTEVLLVDLSSIIHPIFHLSASEPDPNHCSQATVARVHALANGHPHVAVCCDSGRSFRHEIDATYKANRPERDEILGHQQTLAIEALKADGFPVWAVKGFEADDLIATATTKALALPDTDVVIVTADKDLLQLVGPRVKAKSARDGSLIDAAGVVGKFGVEPGQMRDYLTLVGDTSDNVKGATGIGPKRASALLARFRSIDALYEDMTAVGPAQMGLKPAETASLKEFQPRLAQTRSLIALRTDVEIPFETLLAERVSEAAKAFEAEVAADEPEPEPEPAQEAATAPTVHAPEVVTAPAAPAEKALTVKEPEIVLPVPAEYERQLDPRSMREARQLAMDMHASRMFVGYGSPQAVLSTVMVGRELGLPAMASLRSIHNVEGRHTLSASLMVALVLKSGMAEYFEPVSFTNKEATFETLRKGARNPVRLTHTIEMAVTAGLMKPNSNWEKVPTDMLVARAQSRLARMVYPDLLAGLYTPEELAEIRESNREAA